MPLSEVVMDFFDQLKSLSHGYASLDYEDMGYMESKIAKLTVMINGKAVDALSTLVHRERALTRGKSYVSRLKEVIPRQVILLLFIKHKINKYFHVDKFYTISFVC
jgi:translation elongation factor EF-4